MELFEAKAGEHHLQFASLGFDASVSELFVGLAAGACLYLVKDEVKRDGEQLGRYLAAHDISLATLPPGFARQLDMSQLQVLDRLVTAGEAADAVLADAFLSHGTYINAYGPTEASICATANKYGRGSTLTGRGVPIGRPISNVRIYLLSEGGKLQPVGAIGEICIGGEGVGRGYLGQESLTRERFVADPYQRGGRIYKTGDLGRWLTDGRLEFLGRKDEQLKLRGYRIEPGEIEQVLLERDEIKAAAVLVRGRDTDKSLVAYVDGAAELKADELRDYLGQRLPAYMVPSDYIRIAEMPLTTSGKVDKKALLEIDGADMRGKVAFVPPRNDTEERLASIWGRVLEVAPEQISVYDNFFERGGHSLKATRLANQLQQEFGVEIALKDIFDNEDLASQAMLLSGAGRRSVSSIQPLRAQSDYPLSSSQRRLWILSQMEAGNVAYNIPSAYDLKGMLDIEALNRSFEALLRRHEILRTVFVSSSNGEIRQVIKAPDQIKFAIGYHNWKDRTASPEDVIRKDFNKPFDLKYGPLLRANLFEISADRWLFSLVLHHIISDGWSIEILVRELFLLYRLYREGKESELSPLRIQYRDYAAWQQEALRSESMQKQRAYWLDRFRGDIPWLTLPGDRLRPKVKTFRGDVVQCRIDSATTQRIRELGKKTGSTFFMVLLGGIKALLYRYTGQEDLIVGTTITGREHGDLDNQIGFYVNTLALRTKLNGDSSFQEVLEWVRESTVGAFENQSYPFDELISELRLERDPARNPLFDILVEVRDKDDFTKTGKEQVDIEIMNHHLPGQVISRFDIRFVLTVKESEIDLLLEYSQDLYDRDTIERLGKHLVRFFDQVSLHPGTPIGQLSFISGEERQQLLGEFSGEDHSLSNLRSVVHLIREVTEANPQALALQYLDDSITYDELEKRSNRLANYLIENHLVGNGMLVGLLLDRSDRLLIGLLAILKTGAAYVPIDPQYPKTRKAFIINDTGLNVLLTDSGYLMDLDFFDGEILALDLQMETLDTSEMPPTTIPGLNDPAYVIYTSGSTGEPKGCVLTHGNLSNYVLWANRYYWESNVAPSFGLFTSLSFDLTVTSIFCSLTQGGRLLIHDQNEALPAILRKQFHPTEGVNSIKITPSHVQVLKDLSIESTSIQCVILGGEAVDQEVVQVLKSIDPSIRVYNEYGPTETTVGCIAGEVQVDKPITIGSPISGTKVYILDGYNKLCPVGMVGEIFIGGPGVGQAYWRRPELTSERFLSDPFRENQRIYKTGDLGRWLPDGQIEFMGRSDDQVKIRGFRIEPAEIEHLLLNYAGVEQAVVLAREMAGGAKQLVAYLKHRLDNDPDAIKAYLVANLPHYMVPDQYVFLEEFPLTVNGKLDKQALPIPVKSQGAQSAQYVAPRNETEESLTELWGEVLMLESERVGIQDSFFDLGGDSLKAIRLAARVQEVFGTELNINEVFTAPTIEAVAKIIKADRWVEDSKSLRTEGENIIEV